MYYHENPAGLPADPGARKYKDSAALLAEARYSLLGNIRVAVWCFVLYLIIGTFLNQLPSSFAQIENASLSLFLQLFSQYITVVFESLFGIGLLSVFLQFQYGQSASIRNLVMCFRENPDNAIRVRCVVSGGELLALLPLQLMLFFTPRKELPDRIPVLIPVALLCAVLFLFWHITFAMTDYVLLDYPSLSPAEILHTARFLMHGSRMRYFRMMLRLFPVHLLGLFSLGLANLWTGCYQLAASAAFYKDLVEGLSGKTDQNGQK